MKDDQRAELHNLISKRPHDLTPEERSLLMKVMDFAANKYLEAYRDESLNGEIQGLEMRSNPGLRQCIGLAMLGADRPVCRH